jgi:hypothetical protein
MANGREANEAAIADGDSIPLVVFASGFDARFAEYYGDGLRGASLG